MSLLQNNTDALNRLRRCSREELEAVFGSMEPVTGAVVGALHNADTEGMKNILLHGNPAGVIAGLKIAALLTGAERAELVVNCEVNQQELEASAGIVELPLTITRAALINKMLHKNDQLFCLDELAAMADRLMGNTPGLLVALDGDPHGGRTFPFGERAGRGVQGNSNRPPFLFCSGAGRPVPRTASQPLRCDSPPDRKGLMAWR